MKSRPWGRCGRSATLAGLLAAISAASRAQQTIFNVPTADVLEKGKAYLEQDVLYRPWEPRLAVFTLRGVYGLGSQLEAGVNLGGVVTPGRSTPVAVAAVKWQPFKSGGFAATAGAHGLFFLRGGGDGDPSAHVYGHVSWAFASNTRVTAGGWVATPGYAAPGEARGGLFAFEQRLGDHISFDADWYTGRNSLGYFSPGIVSAWRSWTVYAAYSFRNGDSGGNALLLELGFNF